MALMDQLVNYNCHLICIPSINNPYTSMQTKLKLKISSDLCTALKENTVLKNDILIEEIQSHSDQIAYMLQPYYPREKLSKVSVLQETIAFIDFTHIALKLEFVMEEYNACSAVDTINTGRMGVSIYCDLDTAELLLTGEYWPERDAD